MDTAVRAQRGFILPDFNLNEMRKSGMSVVTNPSDDMRAKTSIVLRAYAAMDPGEIARCATYNFVHDGLFVAMMKGMWLAHLADAEARRVRAIDETHGSELKALSDRVQLAVAGLLCVKQGDANSGTGGASVQDFLEKFSEGETVLLAASKYEMKAVLSHPEIQRYSERLWWGWMFDELKAHGAPTVLLFVAIFFSLVVQLALSPLVALLPFIGRWAQEGNHPGLTWLSRFFGVPVIDFLSASVCNMAFLVLLMYHASSGSMYNQPVGYMWFLAVWAFSDFWSELLELTDGFSLKSMKKEFFAIFNENYRSEYTIDPFNIFDLTSCTCATVSLFWYCIARTANVATPSIDILADAIEFDDVAEPMVFISVHVSLVRWLLALAVFFGWMRMLRLLSMSETMGPFILMFLQMFADIIQWLVLLVIILLSTSSALFVLHSLGSPKPYSAISCGTKGTPFMRFEGSWIKMFEGSLIGEPYFDCMGIHNEYGSVDHWFAWVFAVCFQIVVGLLLVNMLIAKMAKTFDSIWENQGVNFMFLRARTCMAWDEAPMVCSPFIALSWPAVVASKLWSIFVGCTVQITTRAGVGAAERIKLLDDDASSSSMGASAVKPRRRGGGSSSSKNASPKASHTASPKLAPVSGRASPPPIDQQMKASARGGASKLRRGGDESSSRDGERKANRQGTTRSMLTSVGARRSQEEATGSDGAQQTWTKQQEAEIVELLMNWILDHEDEVNQSERWRTTMQKKNAKRFDKVDKGINSLAASLKEVKKNQLAGVQVQEKLLELKAMVEELRKAQGPIPQSERI